MLIDLGILLAFMIYSVGTGFALRKKASKGLGEYFLAGKSLKGWQAGMSMAATQFAADTPLLVTGLIATAGIFSLWRLWVYAFAFLLMGFVLGTCWRNAGVLTDAEFTELRYSGKAAAVLRALKAIHLGTLVNCTVLAMVLLAATRIAEPFLTWHEWLPQGITHGVASFLKAVNFSLTHMPKEHPDVWIRSSDNFISILLIVGFTHLYSATGGLRSVVATDIVQFAIAMLATFFYAWIVIAEIGGFGSLVNKLQMLYGPTQTNILLSFTPQDLSQASMLVLAVLGVQWFAQMNADGTGYLAQRTMACQTDEDAKKAAVIFTFAQVVVRSLLWIPIALGLLVLYPTLSLPFYESASEGLRIQREITFASGIKDFLPVGIRGLMLTGMLAALASTIDTHLNWGASYWTNDIYKRFVVKNIFKRESKPGELIWVARASNLGILFIALVIMANLSSIQTAWHLSLLFGSGLGVVLILRWLWYRINIWSEITAASLSIGLSPILLFAFPDLSEGARMLYMVLISTLGIITVTLLTRPESETTLRNFFEKVQPPGFWKPFAPDSKNCILRLQKSLGATFLAGFSAFFMIIGFTQFMVGSRLWSWVFLILGFGLIPLWWRWVFPSKPGLEKSKV